MESKNYDQERTINSLEELINKINEDLKNKYN